MEFLGGTKMSEQTQSFGDLLRSHLDKHGTLDLDSKYHPFIHDAIVNHFLTNVKDLDWLTINPKCAQAIFSILNRIVNKKYGDWLVRDINSLYKTYY